MELYHHGNGNGHGFFEEILDSDNNFAFGFNDQNALLAAPLLESPIITSSSSSTSCLQVPFIFDQNCSSFVQHDHVIDPFVLDHHITFDPNIKLESSHQDYYNYSMFDDACHFVSNLESQGVTGEPERPAMGTNGKNVKPPSKNLMAERRRRKRLNDRLSMLRSVVPNITKMDRTSILADTIDYMKELIEKIKLTQQQMDMDMDMDMGISSNAKPKEIYIRNSPKFEVERRNTETVVWVSCNGKPELLMSTVSTLEALGLQIHRCVISCFNDFTMHASCSEEMEQTLILSSDDIKQALYRNAGYAGNCL
ncbi:hypothetical protein R6Q57_016149 [Mikania cordata]